MVNHAGNQSNLYTSDRVSPHQAEFSLSLENIMYYKPGLTWRTSWLESIGAADEDNFADLYRVAGLRGIYIASQVPVLTNQMPWLLIMTNDRWPPGWVRRRLGPVT